MRQLEAKKDWLPILVTALAAALLLWLIGEALGFILDHPWGVAIFVLAAALAAAFYFSKKSD